MALQMRSYTSAALAAGAERRPPAGAVFPSLRPLEAPFFFRAGFVMPLKWDSVVPEDCVRSMQGLCTICRSASMRLPTHDVSARDSSLIPKRHQHE
jgi:hypothetical protein